MDLRKVLLLPLPAVWLLVVAFVPVSDFKSDQMRYVRVREAHAEKGESLQQLLTDKKLSPDNFHVFLRAFKDEKTLEVWAKNKNALRYTLLCSYDFCTLSGKLGPKQKQGDGQVPEGFYHIQAFNPASNFHLSLGINYPNAYDRIGNNNPGGDIYIHGSCVSIGCIPITNDKIKELYLLAMYARCNGQLRISVHIFPCRLDSLGMLRLKVANADKADFFEFWDNLQQGYQAFEAKQQLPQVSVSSRGKYLFR